MKLNFISFTTIICFSIIILMSCESHIQNIDAAFESIKKEKLLTNDTLNKMEEISPEPKKLEQVKRTESLSEWQRFNFEIEKKIVENENSIKELKRHSTIDIKLFKRISHLEKNNNDLRIQLIEYKKEEQLKWKNFKVQINQDLRDIDSILKDISVNDKIGLRI